MAAVLGLVLAGMSAPAAAATAAGPNANPRGAAHTQVGKASVYAHRFAGRKMADGTPMKPHGNNAASRTLPLGTRARVTNIENGKSATVAIQDRGPYVRGRVIDLSPDTAQEIGISRRQGLARVEVEALDTSGSADGTRGGGRTR
jgi:rare lipoprotein A